MKYTKLVEEDFIPLFHPETLILGALNKHDNMNLSVVAFHFSFFTFHFSFQSLPSK